MPLKIAIVGSGVAGLAVAWNLRDFPCDVTIYERNPWVGGNCRTGWVAVGDEYRFCDLGVNDFNTRAYPKVVKVMDEIGIQYSLLEDSACFYTRDGSVAYTIGGLDYGRMSAALAAEFEYFKTDAPLFLKQNPTTDISIAEYLTNGQYHPDHDYSPRFVNYCILPRVNAMYFVGNNGPGATPFRAVMHYYILQEGFSTPFGPLRMYFHGGAQNWMERLAQFIGVRVVTGTTAQIRADWEGVNYYWWIGQERYDYVVLACHADEARKAFQNPPPELQPVLDKILGSFSYAPSRAYAHTYAGILPRDPNLWRTYNVTINDPAAKLPYSMTYVCNHHQNDRKSGEYNFFGGPQILVTLNPALDISRDEFEARYVLKDANTNEPITWEFPHNIMDLPALRAQQALNDWQSGKTGGKLSKLFFTGGWCYGSGLHEECWIYSTAVAEAIKNGDKFVPPHDPESPPPHILDALGEPAAEG